MADRQCLEPGCSRFRTAGSQRCRQHSVDFYLAALPSGLRDAYEQAARLESLDQEIRLLRSLVRRAAEEHPDTPDFRHKCALLIRAVLVQRQLSQQTRGKMEESVLSVLRGLNEVMEEEA